MRGIERLHTVERTTPTLSAALPELPPTQTAMIRLIRIAAFGLEDYFAKVFRDLGLTEKSYHALCVLVANKNQQASPSELSELIGTSRANMTKILASLEKQGYIERQTIKTDARRNLIVLTTAGKGIVDEHTPSVAGPVSSAFSGLNDTELGQLESLLKKMIISFDEASF